MAEEVDGILSRVENSGGAATLAEVGGLLVFANAVRTMASELQRTMDELTALVYELDHKRDSAA